MVSWAEGGCCGSTGGGVTGRMERGRGSVTGSWVMEGGILDLLAWSPWSWVRGYFLAGAEDSEEDWAEASS